MRKTSMRKRLLVGAAALSLTGLGLVIAGSPAYPSVSTDSGFEVDDGNLEPASGADWNSFDPLEWPGTPAAPYRRSTPKIVTGWTLNGFEDDQDSGTDTVFGGGVKQNDDCGKLQSGPKPPNKDDLKRVYISYGAKSVGGSDHIFLNLAWVRIPQNTTSPSAHVAFEFNKATSGQCTGASSALVKRTAGDMLVVYDFQGGDADNPTLKLSRWLTAASDASLACEVGSRPCWGDTKSLTGLGYAEARVNTTTVGTVTDELTPPSPPDTTSVDETLGLNEFGEAGIDLTNAGVFTANQCESFGSAYAVSRSSGTSSQAQMKDIVGPGPININNCGALRILKKSLKTGSLVSTSGAEFNVDGPDSGTDADFKIIDNGAAAITPKTLADEIGDDSATTAVEGLGELCVSGLPPGSYSVIETKAPTGYADAPSTQDGQSVTLQGGSNCSTAKPADAASASFTNAPLADIQVNFRDGGSGETALVDPAADSITCVDQDSSATLPTGNNTLATGWDNTLNVPGIPIGTTARTIVCTIKIDP